jgi:deazaflavin-dependent oxidoreductase (nitroreductase family)
VAPVYSEDVTDLEDAKEASMAGKRDHTPRLPPRWFIRLVWFMHRVVYRVTRGRIGLWRPKGTRWGTLRLTTTGRQTGRQRSVIVGYFEDGGNLVTMAMNGWGEGEPAWWLNLQANPDARVDLVEGPRRVRAHAATGSERVRLWDRWRQIDDNLDAYAAMRPSETAGVVLEPRPDPPGSAKGWAGRKL